MLAIASVGVGAALGFTRLENYVVAELATRVEPSVIFPDLSPELAPLAREDLERAAAETMQQHAWTDDRLCREIAKRVQETGWVARVHRARRHSDGRIQVACAYRHPAAMIQSGNAFYLVDTNGIRLPGEYRYDADRPLIQGVLARAPESGEAWTGSDVAAALAILRKIAVQPYRHQITAVLVHNAEGRVDARSPHIELATDHAGGRIRWGSAPGFELEENSVAQKLAILKANFLRTGRIDAHHPVIDISTFSDRFSIPGA